MSSTSLQAELISFLPNLRAFAVSLCGNLDLADDIVQEALLRAWTHLDTFQKGTNLRAWLFTIVRNSFHSHLRRRRKDPSVSLDEDDVLEMAHPPEQPGWMDSRDLIKALRQLGPEQREALILVAVEGFSYEEVAQITDCPIGTVKSRVNRARNHLLELLDTKLSETAGMPETQPTDIAPALGEIARDTATADNNATHA